LGQNLQAKIADLGLSKTYISDGHTHISATAAGTAGYMDPEYVFDTFIPCFFFDVMLSFLVACIPMRSSKI
jgi:serine/threonine protein kinase